MVVGYLTLSLCCINDIWLYGISYVVSMLYVLFLLYSASLSMLPWPKPAVWPSLPADASPQVLAKEKVNFDVVIQIWSYKG